MNSKTYLQLFIILLIVVTSSLIYQSYFKKVDYYEDQSQSNVSNEIINIEKNKEDDINKNQSSSIIQQLKYKSSDSLGNDYIIESKSAQTISNNYNLLKLIDVAATILLRDKDPVYIYSDFAEHDKKSFDTKFYGNVKILHTDIFIKSENLDLFYKDSIASLYNIEEAYNKDTKLIADKIDFDMLTKDLTINMYDNNETISILKK